MGCCGTGTTCAVLPCKNALPRGSPDTVKTGVALQPESKTGALAVAAVGVFFSCGCRCCSCFWCALLRWLWCLRGLYWSWSFVNAALRLSREGTWWSRNSSKIGVTTLLRDPATLSAVPLWDILLPALGRTKRAITISATGRTRKRICKEIECQLWVPAWPYQSKSLRGWDCRTVPFLDAAIAVKFAAPLAC